MRLLLALIALLLAGPLAAAPAMWVVRDADTEVTLYGTIHTLPQGTDWLTPAAAARFDAADSLVLETIIPDDRFELASAVANLGINPTLKPIAERVAPRDKTRVAAAAASAAVPMLALDRMKLWLAAITLSEANLRADGFTAEAGAEATFTARAKAAAKPIVGLETIEQQLGYFNAVPEADQKALMTATLDEIGDAKAETAALLAAWQRGDVDRIARDFARDARATPTLTRVLLTDRNARWATWIAGVMKRPGKVFVAVGAGNFGGPDGLIARLTAMGLHVERVE